MEQLERQTIQPDWFWNDAWDGYPFARKRLLSDAFSTGLRNPVFLTGDWHSTFVHDLKLDFDVESSPVVATEFVTPAITTGGDGTPYGLRPYYAPMIPFNPHIKYYEGDKRGYFKASVTPERMLLDLRFVTSVEDPNGAGYTQASWVVENAGRSLVVLRVWSSRPSPALSDHPTRGNDLATAIAHVAVRVCPVALSAWSGRTADMRLGFASFNRRSLAERTR